jgi:hypothetical protein
MSRMKKSRAQQALPTIEARIRENSIDTDIDIRLEIEIDDTAKREYGVARR